MKKIFINPEIKISLFNQERVCTNGTVEINPEAVSPAPASVVYNFNNALKWLKDTNHVDAQNIISFKE